MRLCSGLCGIWTWLAICKDTESSTTHVMAGLCLEDCYLPSHVSDGCGMILTLWSCEYEQLNMSGILRQIKKPEEIFDNNNSRLFSYRNLFQFFLETSWTALVCSNKNIKYMLQLDNSLETVFYLYIILINQLSFKYTDRYNYFFFIFYNYKYQSDSIYIQCLYIVITQIKSSVHFEKWVWTKTCK